MFKITSGSTHDLPDVSVFLETITALHRHPLAEARTLFDTKRPLVVTRAPGRLDVMGGIADYSGSLVLQLPIKEAAFVALQRDDSRTLRIVSLGAEENGRAADFTMPLADFEPAGDPIEYDAARDYFRRDPKRQWAAYAAGAFLALMRNLGTKFPGGARILISSQVPEGKGVSSSAALEVAVMSAIAAAFDLQLDPRELALLCQKVENFIVGAPCGVMDQMTAACGRENALLALLCQPAEIQGFIPVPAEIAFWGIDSGIRHAVSASDYTSVRAGAFMGYRIFLKDHVSDTARQKLGDDPYWQGYLANITPSQFETLSRSLPQSIRGAAFLEKYGPHADPVTQVDAAREYAVYNPTAHPIHEHFRVRLFAELLTPPMSPAKLALLGQLMFQSDQSYARCGLSSRGTGMLVNSIDAVGAYGKVFGAKITGGGSGGTVAVLGRRDAADHVAAVARTYGDHVRTVQQGDSDDPEFSIECQRISGAYKPYIFSGSSPGAAAFGHLVLKPTGVIIE